MNRFQKWWMGPGLTIASLDESFGIEEWHERLARFAPEGWYDEWGNRMVWPPVFHDELVALLGGG